MICRMGAPLLPCGRLSCILSDSVRDLLRDLCALFAQSEEGLLLETPGIAVSQLLHEVVSMVTEEGKEAIGYCVSFVASSTASPRALHKTKLTEGMVHGKVRLLLTFGLQTQ